MRAVRQRLGECRRIDRRDQAILDRGENDVHRAATRQQRRAVGWRRVGAADGHCGPVVVTWAVTCVGRRGRYNRPSVHIWSHFPRRAKSHFAGKCFPEHVLETGLVLETSAWRMLRLLATSPEHALG
jgi:hypothetical protein